MWILSKIEKVNLLFSSSILSQKNNTPIEDRVVWSGLFKLAVVLKAHRLRTFWTFTRNNWQIPRYVVSENEEVINILHVSVVSSSKDHLGMEKAIHKLGAAFAHTWTQMESCDNFEGLFSVVQPQTWRILSPFRNCGRNNVLLQQISDQAAIETGGFSERIDAESDQDVCINKRSLHDSFLNAHRIIRFECFRKGRTVNGYFYAISLDRFNNDLKEKWPHLAKKKLLSHQDKRIVLWNTSLCAIFSGFYPKWLVPVAKLEKKVRCGEIGLHRWNQ